MTHATRYRRRALAAAVAALVLALMVALGLGAAGLQARANQQLLQRAVQDQAQKVSLQLAQLQLNVEHGLRGARSILIAAGGLNRMGADSFNSYQLTANLAREYPGVKGFGLVRLVPWGPGGATRMMVQFVEPQARNADLQGLDLAADPAVHAVAVSALAGGDIQLANVPSAQGLQLLALMALRLPGSPDEGWAMAAMQLDEVVATLQLTPQALALRVQEAAGSAGQSFTDLLPLPAGCVAEGVTEHRAFDRRWTLTLCAQQAYADQLSPPSPTLAGLGAAGAAGVFAGLTLAIGLAWRRGRERSMVQMRLASFINQAGDAVVAADIHGRVSAWNPAASACFGWSAEEAIGRALPELLLAPEAVADFAALSDRVLAGGQVASQEMQARHRQGRLVDLTVSQTAVLADNGNVEGVTYTFVDISARKALQREQGLHNERLAQQVAERTSALEAARNELQAVIDAMPSLVSYYNLGLICQFANQAHREWLGLDPATLPGRKLEELVDAATLELIRPYVEDARAGRARRLYRDFPRPDNNGTRRVLAHYQPVMQHGAVCGIFMLIHDVDELHGSQQALAQERERLQNIVRSTGAGTWEWDIVQGKVLVNQRFQDITGRKADALNVEPLGRRMDIMHPDDVPEMRTRVLAHLRGETELYEMECRILHGNGHWVWVRDTGRVSDRNEQGRALRMFGTTLDISLRKQAEQQLQDNERRFRFFSDHVEEGIMVAERGVIVDVSEVLARMFRCSVADAIGRNPVQFIAPSAPDELQQQMLQHSGKPFETWLQRGDGSTFPALVRSRDVLDREAAGVATSSADRTLRLTTVLDISRQKQTEAALLQARADAERASQAKSQFLANMSHEIRTPLNAVIGLSYLFQDTALDTAQRSLVGKIQLAGRALLSLINDVLDLSKIEAGEMVLDHSAFVLPEVLNDVVRMLSGQAEAKGLRLQLHIGAGLSAAVLGDELRLRQILVNLVGNAIKFTDSGSVSLSAVALPTPQAAPSTVPTEPTAPAQTLALRLEVRDTGIGIADDALPRLFTAFTQADNSNARRFSGTGLGLSIVRQLVELMSGRVGVDSRLGHGSCFWLELQWPWAGEDSVRSGGSTLSVLLAEDDPAQRDELATMARSLGWQVETVPDGATLVQRVIERLQTDRPPDALLVDWKMPGLDGLSALAQLRQAVGVGALPPAVVLSSSAAADVLAAPHAALADAVLSKPVNPSTLFNAINSAVVRQQGSPERLLFSTRMDGTDTQWLAGVKVLVVDDSDINLEVARHLLERQGAEVQTAANGALALQLLDHSEVDAVLMDVQMPVMDGNEATRQLRRNPRMHKLPVIALTAGALLAERQRALEAGMTDFLTKPLDPEQLVRTLRRHIEAARGQPLQLQQSPSSSPALPAASPWPQITGIDSEEAQTRLGHDSALFLRLVKRLLNEFRHAAAAPAQGWAQGAAGALAGDGGNPPLAARLHKLRGAAGMVAATAVHRLAGEAEAAAQQPDPATALAHLMPALDRALQELAEHAQACLQSAAEPTASASAGSTGTPRVHPQQLAELRTRLQRSDLSALELAQTLDGALRAHLGAAGHAQWRDLLDALDFRGAEPLLQGVVLDADLGTSTEVAADASTMGTPAATTTAITTATTSAAGPTTKTTTDISQPVCITGPLSEQNGQHPAPAWHHHPGP